MAKQRTEFQRNQNTRKPQRERILIVCEDSKKAPAYFEGVREDLGLAIPTFSKKKTCYKALYQTHLKRLTATAIKNSKTVLKQVAQMETDNPSTQVHIVVEHLIKESKK